MVSFNDIVYANPTTVVDVHNMGKTMMNRANKPLGKLHRGSPEDVRFREKFGAGPSTVLDAWRRLNNFELVPEGGMFYHLLWALMFMKTYSKEKDLCGNAGGKGGAVDPKIFRKWIWLFIKALGLLEFEVVSPLASVDCCIIGLTLVAVLVGSAQQQIQERQWK
jgi:hypothetical protein